MLSIKIFLTQRKYFASAFLFSCFSLIFSTWVTYIPHIAENLGISEGKIGGAIFFAGFGSLVIIPVANKLVNQIGIGRSTYFSLILYSLTLFGPFLAYNYISLCIALFIFGMASSVYAISLNSLTATIEKQDNVFIMTGSHGFWSIGGMVGAASGSFISGLIPNPLIHVSSIVVFIIAIQTLLRTNYIFRKGEILPKEKRHYNHIRSLLIIASVGLIFMVAEGAIADWSALYLKKIITIPLQYIGLGYATFSMAMMIGRFTGDSLSKKFGSWQLLTYACTISILGFILVLVLNPFISLLGFFVVGLGFSVMVPEVYRLASKIEGVKTSDGVSFIAASSNIGFLIGPVLLGFLAELKSLHLSFIVLTAFVSIAFFIALWKRNRIKRK